jgi:hypothetical protein
MIAFLLVFVRFGRTIRRSFRDPEFQVLFGSVLTTLAVGTIFYHNVEHWRWLDSVYFCTITLATVGYGDFSPQTDLGKAFTILYVLIGLGIIAGFAGYMAQRFEMRTTQRMRAQLTMRSDDPTDPSDQSF